MMDLLSNEKPASALWMCISMAEKSSLEKWGTDGFSVRDPPEIFLFQNKISLLTLWSYSSVLVSNLFWQLVHTVALETVAAASALKLWPPLAQMSELVQVLTALIHHCNHMTLVSLWKWEIAMLADVFLAQNSDFVLLFWLCMTCDARVASPRLVDRDRD